MLCIRERQSSCRLGALCWAHSPKLDQRPSSRDQLIVWRKRIRGHNLESHTSAAGADYFWTSENEPDQSLGEIVVLEHSIQQKLFRAVAGKYFKNFPGLIPVTGNDRIDGGFMVLDRHICHSGVWADGRE